MDIRILVVLNFLKVRVCDLRYLNVTLYNLLLLFHIANDKLDANTASEYELRTVEKVKEKTAHEICKKRLFNDEVDLYSKVSINKQAKKRIKVVKKN